MGDESSLKLRSFPTHNSYFLFHNYLLRYTISTDTSAGLTPLMREA